jgi:hypothetical protein
LSAEALLQFCDQKFDRQARFSSGNRREHGWSAKIDLSLRDEAMIHVGIFVAKEFDANALDLRLCADDARHAIGHARAEIVRNGKIRGSNGDPCRDVRGVGDVFHATSDRSKRGRLIGETMKSPTEKIGGR